MLVDALRFDFDSRHHRPRGRFAALRRRGWAELCEISICVHQRGSARGSQPRSAPDCAFIDRFDRRRHCLLSRSIDEIHQLSESRERGEEQWSVTTEGQQRRASRDPAVPSRSDVSSPPRLLLLPASSIHRFLRQVAAGRLLAR